MKLLVIIPAYNESKSILSTLQEVHNVLESLEAYDSKILVVDDCSRDQTASVAVESGLSEVLELPVNLGIGGAVQAGYIYAKENDFDFAMQIDGDGQHDPKEMPKLLEALHSQHVDMVIGSRFIGDNIEYIPSKLRRLGMRFSRAMLKWGTKKEVYDTTSGFRVVNKKLIALFSNQYPRVFAGVVPLVMVSRNHFTFSEIKANFRYRQHGKSSIKLVKSVFYPFSIFLAILGVLIRKENVT